MPDTTDKHRDKPAIPDDKDKSTLSKLLWFIVLYCAGLAAVIAVAWFFRALLGMN